ncbi:hypothetical protein B0A55_11833 [Friedmanniomyces simplex]|uniref:Reverse transcriptase Ty1/copia-type domain-containing protein n=1 Tax=Friedmanniomyces simplex TaxID=329884 RepID=A0A4U0WHN9_9PEZI|nr:hypothetical protein B0A55_11833 [Friedmanniomyces simplex]
MRVLIFNRLWGEEPWTFDADWIHATGDSTVDGDEDLLAGRALPPPGRRAAEQAPRGELDSQDIDRTLLQDDDPFFEREDSIPRDSEEPELEEPSEISDNITVKKGGRKKGSKNKVHEQVEEYQRHTRSKTKQEETESLPPLPDQDDDFEEFHDVQFAFRAALKAATASPDPQTVTEALNGENADELRAAIKKEFKNHDQNGTWEVVRRSEAIVNNQRVLRGRMIMKSKYNKLHEIENLKARYVVRGFRQEYGKDYTDTFAGVCKNTSVKTLLALAALFDWEIEQMDAIAAFLNSGIKTKVYIELPPGYARKDGKPLGKEWVARLLKALYGLKQSLRLWQEADKCVYLNSESKIIIITHVDDTRSSFGILR